MKSLFTGAALALTVALALPAHADKVVFAIGATPGSLQGKTAQEFTSRLQERLGDEHAVELYTAGQLGDERELVQKLRLGTVHLTLASSIMPSLSDDFALFDLPFLVKDRDHLKRIEEAVFWPEIAPTAEASGVTVLGLWENGIRHITNNARAINVPADLNGLKIRTPPSEWRVKMFQAYGANPTPMAFSEVFVGLQTGVIDGQENPLTNIDGAKLQEVQKFLSITGHVYTPSYLVAGTGAFARLSPEVQQAIGELGREVQAWAFEQGALEDEQLAEQFRAGGMEINVADRQAFVDASTPIYEEFAAQVPAGRALIDAALKLAE